VVSFPGTPEAECPGPNYIVQGMCYQVESKIYFDSDSIIDYAIDWAIVQTQNWSTLYILSRERQPAPASIDVSRFGLIPSRPFKLISLQAWIARAVAFGSDASTILKFNQTGCEDA
jgi:apolipoprotein D and lipocalin family protein